MAAPTSSRPGATPQAVYFVPIYYTFPNGRTLGATLQALGKAHDLESLAYLSAVAVTAGPPAKIRAIRFPAGTHPLSVHVTDHIATVDLSDDVKKTPPGSLTEGGEFEALVWTLTSIPGISQIKILVHGATVPTLPGGHFELDEPLSRKDW